jgi:hypothetical protein
MIDVVSLEIRYGDSLGFLPIPTDLSRLQLFMSFAGGLSYKRGFDLQLVHQMDGYSCAITVCDLISELVLCTTPWVPQERDLRRVEYALFLCLAHKLCSQSDLDMSDDSLLAIKGGVLARNGPLRLLSNIQAVQDPVTAISSPVVEQASEYEIANTDSSAAVGHSSSPNPTILASRVKRSSDGLDEPNPGMVLVFLHVQRS